VVESQPSKLLVAGSIPVSRSRVEPLCGRDPERSRRGEPAGEIPTLSEVEGEGSKADVTYKLM
jgi:hypothetical protein